MGKSTSIQLAVIRAVNRPGEHLGPCEGCGKPAHEQFFANTNTVYRTADGVPYLSAPTGGSYGHRECLEVAYDHPHDATGWQRLRNLRVVPDALIEAVTAG